MERVAIHREDIDAFDLPPLRIKVSDSRAAAFAHQHGVECVELDALPPSELRRRLKEEIEERIDWSRWERAIAVERAELASIERIAGKIARLKTVVPGAISGGSST
jgi:hypothetical protein